MLPPPHDAVEAWHYQPQGAVDFDGVSDSEGNLYFVECLRQGSSLDACSARSFTRDGVDRFTTRLGAYQSPQANSRQLISGTQWIIVGRTTISAIETLTGALTWERSLTRDISDAECCPTCASPPGQELAPIALAADGLGAVHLGLARTTTAASSQRGAILTYAVEHGTVLRWRPLGRGVADLAFDATGDLLAGLLQVPAGSGAEVQSFDPSGAVRFSAQTMQSPWPLAVFGTTALLGTSGETTSTINGAVTPAPRASLASTTHPLFDVAGRWSVGRTDAQPGIDRIWLEVFDPTGVTLESTNAVSESAFAYQPAAVTEAVLAQGGVLVVAGYQGHLVDTSNGPTPMPLPPLPGWSRLMGLRADGGVAFSCVLGGSRFTVWSGAVSLSANRWASMATTDCPVCDADFGLPVLRVFEAPGLELQRSGWVTARGDREHTGRAR